MAGKPLYLEGSQDSRTLRNFKRPARLQSSESNTMPIGAVNRLESERIRAHDVEWCRAFRARCLLVESYQGSSGSELSDSDLEEVPSLEVYQRKMVERHENVTRGRNQPDAAGVQHLPASADHIARNERESELFFQDPHQKRQAWKTCPRCSKHSGCSRVSCRDDECAFKYRLTAAEERSKKDDGSTTKEVRVHSLKEGTVQKVIDWEHGLDPLFADMTEGQVTRGIWFKHANKWDMDHITAITMARHKCRKVCAFIVGSHHAAAKAITYAKGSAPMYVSMITLPIKGMRIVRLN